MAQTTRSPITEKREGLTFGTSIGAGLLNLTMSDSTSTLFATTIPNLRLGYMVNDQLALQMFIPGAIYSNSGNIKALEGLCLSGQYWAKERLWLLAGIGITIDAPAFWTIDNLSQAEFNFGFPALTCAVGYEVLQKDKFAIDIYYRIFFGKAELDNGFQKKGLFNSVSVGFNWY